MSTNKFLLQKGIKHLTGALPLLFLGPVVIYNAFMNKHTAWHYLVLGIGIIFCLLAMWFIFSGLRWIVKGIFND